MSPMVNNRRSRRRALVAVLAATTLVASLVGYAAAVHDDGFFELDRNATSDPAVAGEDWDVVYAGTDTASASSFTADGSGPTIFTGGGSKDDLDTPGWQHKTGSTPPKDELLDGFAARYGDIIYFGADRYSNSGDAVMGFWFFQGDVVAQLGGTFGPDDHEDGDILILSDFTGGGGNVTIRVFQWNGPGGTTPGSGAINGTLDLIAGSLTLPADCVGPPSVPTGDPFCATVNTADTPSPWPFQSKSGADRVFPPGHFYEGGIDLAFLGLEDECFASFLAETRSSTSVNATLKDFVGGSFAPCTSSVTTTPSNAAGTPVSAIEVNGPIYDKAEISSTGGTGTPGGTVDFYLCSPAQLNNPGTLPNGDPDDPTTCDLGGTLITDNATVTAGVAMSTVANPSTTGTWCWRGEYSGDPPIPAATDSSTGECFNVVDARISVTPLLATNESGATHTITARVEQDTGSGFVLAPAGTTVTFSLLNNNASAVFTPAAPAGATCTTVGTTGECSIQITTTATGTVDIRASSTLTVGGVSVTRTTTSIGTKTDANKRFVNAQIDLSPLTDTNSIGENHVITATVQQDDGLAATTGGGDAVTGYGPAPTGTLVVFSFTQNTISATFVADGTDSNSDGNSGNDCVTIAAGTCSITITSSTAGTVLVRATTTFTIGPAVTEEVTRTTGSGGINSADAEKIFVAGSLTWLKHDNAVNLLGGATFEVCRTHTLDTSTDPDTMVDITTDVCVSVVDNAAPDQDADAGEFRLTNLILGRYTVTETAAPAGYVAAGGTQSKDLTIAAPNGSLTIAFVNNREVLKITGFGYTNSATGIPTSGVISGVATYTVNLHNYGLTAATLSNSSIVASVTGAGSGTLVCNGDGAAPARSKAIIGTVPAGGDLGPITLACTYTNMTDGAVISANLNIKSTTNGSERLASGSPATISFTVQGD